MIEKDVFEDLVRSTLANLFDYAALETHPLGLTIFTPPPDFEGSQVEYIRQLFCQTIESFRPQHKEPSPTAPEWRAYWILHKRYVEGVDLHNLAAWLAVSERQMRRDHHRAIQAIADILWKQLFTNPAAQPNDQLNGIQVKIEAHRAGEIITSVLETLARRLEEKSISILYQPTDAPDDIITDRVILRQLLISLILGILHLEGASQLTLSTHPRGDTFNITLTAKPANGSPARPPETIAGALKPVQEWAKIIGATPQRLLVDGAVQYQVSFSRANRKLILVIDDQPPAITLIQRFVASSRLDVIGASSFAEALTLIQQHEPDLIVLDVMMPDVDGWESLQVLKVREETRDTPILIYSAWDDPELARSLGAAGSLKKPITKQAFTDALAQLGLQV